MGNLITYFATYVTVIRLLNHFQDINFSYLFTDANADMHNICM